MQSVVAGSGGKTTTTEFVYNANGQRVSVWNGSNTQLRGQYYWGSQPVAFYVPSSSTHFQHQDWLGTERLRTSYNGTVEGSYTSLPFGDDYTPTGSDLDPYHYAQLDYDSESGTDHAQYRQYSSAQGRWMRPDPYSGSYDFSNPQSMNRYVYAENAPLSAVDPSGLLYCVPVAINARGGRRRTIAILQFPEFRRRGRTRPATTIPLHLVGTGLGGSRYRKHWRSPGPRWRYGSIDWVGVEDLGEWVSLDYLVPLPSPQNSNAPSNDPNRTAINHQCVAEATAAAADDFNAATTMPKARNIVGRGLIAGILGRLLTNSNPWAAVTTAAGAFADNIGGAIVGSVKYALTDAGCRAQNGVAYTPTSF